MYFLGVTAIETIKNKFKIYNKCTFNLTLTCDFKVDKYDPLKNLEKPMINLYFISKMINHLK